MSIGRPEGHERVVREREVGTSPVRVVEHVEYFGAELQVQSFCEPEYFCEREVSFRQSRSLLAECCDPRCHRCQEEVE